MEAKKVKVRKLFFIWQDEDEERWLEEMARNGLHLASVSSFGRYTFQQGKPREFVYRLDYQEKMKQEMQDYYQLFRDAGWEFVGERSFFKYFRKPRRAGEVNEIFTDNRSKIAKYKRILLFFLISLIGICPAFILTLTQLNNNFCFPPFLSFFRYGIQVVMLLSIGLWFYGFIKLYLRIRELQKEAPSAL